MYTAAVMPAEVKDQIVQFRTTRSFRRVLTAVAKEFGGNQTAAIEFLVREYARRNRLKIEDEEVPEQPDRAADTRAGYSADRGE